MPIYMKIDGVEGDVTVRGLEGAIEIESWSWGASNANPGGGGGGGGAGKASFSDLSFSASSSKASPQLMLKCCQGTHIREAKLFVRKQGEPQPLEYMKIEMENVRVSSYQVGGDDGSPQHDAVTLNFTKLTFTYTPQSESGVPGPPVTHHWDIKRNTGG